MNNKNSRWVPSLIARFLAILFAPVAALQAAQAVPTQQTLDRVFAFDGRQVLNMGTGNAYPAQEFTPLGIQGSAFTTCTLTAVTGLYCLDGQLVRNWPNPMDPATSTVVLDCMDGNLGLDRKGDGCTGMTVDQSGAIWLAGKKRNGFSVIKVVKASCSAPLNGGVLCATELYAGRPQLIDLVAIDGDAASKFSPCSGCAPMAGVLGIEERKNAVFFPDPLAALKVVVGSRDWGLNGKELLQDVTLLQVPNGALVDNYILAVTSTGRILARNTTGSTAAAPVYTVAGGSTCPAGTPASTQYGLRRSATSSTVYVSDPYGCRVLGLKPGATATLTLVPEQRLVLDANNNPVYQDLILATTDGITNVSTVGLTVAPGISFLLSDCRIGQTCTIINGAGATRGAWLTDVQLANYTNSGAVVFQISGIPDCRYQAQDASLTADCTLPGIAAGQLVISPGGCGASCPPAAQSLNVTPLLPADVVNAFRLSGLGNGTLPQMLISPQYRARTNRQHRFDALFVLPNPTVRFINTFEGHVDVASLEETAGSYGCPGGPTLVNWDVVTIVSELFRSTNGEYIDSLANTGCGTTKLGTSRFSLVPYGLEVTPDTYGPLLVSNTVATTPGNDAVFARMLQKLYGELNYVQREYACKAVDPVPGAGGATIISAPIADCTQLESIWSNGQIKLDKCIAAAFQPKQSATDENCQSFVSQLTNYEARLPVTTPSQDVANRVGELKVRIKVIFHLYEARFLPSVPATGFCRERKMLEPAISCPNPWY